MRIIILAAGRGRRLSPLTDTTHKTLLKIGEKTILEHTIDNFKFYKIHDFQFVLGYRANDIIDFLDKKGINYSYVINDIWDKTNNIYSLYLALKEGDSEDIILIDSDIFFSYKILESLFRQKETAFLVRKGKLTEEDMKVVIKDNRILKISKEIPLKEASGESIGIEYFTKKDYALLKSELGDVIENETNGKNLFYEYAFQRLIDKKLISPYSIIINDFACEIDTREDLDFAKNILKKN